jgi:Asp-tRNA(Asn)/Glu-tRNA(Gln) amidotransferase A subunit family amidase
VDLPPARHGTLGDFRVLVIDSLPGVGADSDIRDAVSNLAGALSESGATVSDDTGVLARLDLMHPALCADAEHGDHRRHTRRAAD